MRVAVVLSRSRRVPAIGILSIHPSRDTPFPRVLSALAKHPPCTPFRAILYPQSMQPKRQSSDRRVPRKPPALEFLRSAIAKAQVPRKGRVTQRDLKSQECKHLHFRRLKSAAWRSGRRVIPFRMSSLASRGVGGGVPLPASSERDWARAPGAESVLSTNHGWPQSLHEQSRSLPWVWAPGRLGTPHRLSSGNADIPARGCRAASPSSATRSRLFLQLPLRSAGNSTMPGFRFLD